MLGIERLLPEGIRGESMNFQQKARHIPCANCGQHTKKGGRAAFRLLEHTADMGIEAVAPSCDELFVQAAKALLSILAGQGRAFGDVQERTIEVTAGDMEELLVVWLNELLFMIQARGLWPLDMAVGRIHAGALEMRLRVVPLAANPEREIKAVTYHHLLVTHRHGQWRARVYLDL
jgi:SHS2 domain-containing protein